jgi:dolichol-phosphate mannosyltransferase
VPDSCELSITLPAYREAETLRHLLPRIRAAAGRLTADYEIVVVDALRPVDDTQKVCADCGVRHVFRTNGDSFGDAIRTAIRESRGRFVMIMDADGSHNPDDFERLWCRRHEGDIIIGSRYTAGGRTKVHAGLTLQSQILNVTCRWALGLQIRDMSNNFRLYRGEQLRALSLMSTNFEILQEILARLAWGPAQARILEVPITFEKRNAGESKRNLSAFIISYLRSIRNLRRFRAAARAQ